MGIYRRVRASLGGILIFGSVASILMYYGYTVIPHMSKGGIPYPSNWVIGNLVFFTMFGVTVFVVFNRYIRQKDSYMRQNWTETKRFRDMNTCPECGSDSVSFDYQDARLQMMFARCNTCGKEWIFNMIQE